MRMSHFPFFMDIKDWEGLIAGGGTEDLCGRFGRSCPTDPG